MPTRSARRCEPPFKLSGFDFIAGPDSAAGGAAARAVSSAPARSHLAAIVESADDAIISKTLDGAITSWNRGAELLFGFTAAEVIGQTIFLIIPPERQLEEGDVLGRIRRGEIVARGAPVVAPTSARRRAPVPASIRCLSPTRRGPRPAQDRRRPP